MTAVSCTFDGCMAVGSYLDSAGGNRALAETVSSTGAVSASEGPQPGDAAAGSSTSGRFSVVSCLSMTDCVAGGNYRNTVSANAVGLLDNFSGGSWSTVSAPVPSTEGSGAAAQSGIAALSCSSRGACDAAGTVWDPGANRLPLLESYTPAEGYWTDASDGGIFNYGNAVFHGSSVANSSTHRWWAWRAPGRRRLLGGGHRRWHLQLRRRRVPRVDGQPPLNAHRRHGGDA